MVLLGPKFVHDLAESFLVPWEPATVVSVGKQFTILLSNDPDSWSPTGPNRKPVCVAVAGDTTYICTNGAESAHRYLPCFVDVKTGAVIERRLPGISAYTNSWEIVVIGSGNLCHTVIKYPLESAPDPLK